MDIQDVVKKDLCLGCGICTYDKNVSKMSYNSYRGIYYPKFDRNKEHIIANELCPGKGYEIEKLSSELYCSLNNSLELGRYHSLFAGHSNSKAILQNASSGGLITEFLLYLLRENLVDYVVVTKFEYSINGPKTKTYLTNRKEDILESQGSKYCPVDVSNVIQEIRKIDGRVAYLGTPCQIAGIRNLQKIDKDFDHKIFITIANFCGGFKSYNFIRKIAKRHSINYKNINFFRFRGGGQPGSMLIKDSSNKTFEASYKLYGGYSGFSKIHRCHLCVDATGELADISFGDAWLERYLQDKWPWSVILTRTEFTTKLMNDMTSKKNISMEPISFDDVCLSQRSNITSKKYRQYTRMRFYKRLGYILPKYDGGYKKEKISIKTEILVFSKHRINELLERIGLYKYFRILIGKGY